MTARVLPLKPNWRTHERQRRERLATRDRLIARIGINPADAPLFSEELRMMAHLESLKK